MNWFEKERNRDKLEIKSVKDKLIKDIKGLDKNDLFPQKKPVKKSTIWQKIKRMIWGN
jgi:hypothetical protein